MPHYTSEHLEPRRVLSGLTLIVPDTAASLPAWVSSMSAAIDRRAEPPVAAAWANVARYRMKLAMNGSAVVVDSFTRTDGPAPATSATAESVVALDWSAVTASSTDIIAQTVAEALRTANTSLGFGTQGPFNTALHLIGDGRGGSLANELATRVGIIGVVVDQLTLLEPVTAASDPVIVIPDNVIFADNFIDAAGTSVGGANNVSIDLGTSGAPLHTYYHATIARGATTDGTTAIDNAWFVDNHTRATTGFNASRLGGSPRANAGIGAAGGGSAARVNVTPAGTAWPNAQLLSVTGGTNGRVEVGQTVTFTYRYQTHTNATEIDMYLDNDGNSTNGFGRFLATVFPAPSTGATPNTVVKSTTYTWSSFNLTPGLYNLVAFITDGTRVRQISSPLPILVNNTGMDLVTRRWTDDLTNGDASDPRNYSPGGTLQPADRVLFDSGSATLTQPAAISTAHVIKAARLATNSSVSIDRLQVLDTATVTLNPSGHIAMTTKQLTLSAAARIDLTDNAMIVDYNTTTPFASLEASVRSARAGGTWTGAGLGSSVAATMPGGVVGIAESTDVATGVSDHFLGSTLDATSVLIRYTFAGDADLNGKVDFADLVRLAQNYGNTAAHYTAGDFDFDGDVDFSDLVLLAQNYGHSLPVSHSAVVARLR